MVDFLLYLEKTHSSLESTRNCLLCGLQGSLYPQDMHVPWGSGRSIGASCVYIELCDLQDLFSRASVAHSIVPYPVYKVNKFRSLTAIKEMA